MKVQTAGEQKYQDLIGEKLKSRRTGMIVSISLIALALICGFSNILISAVLGVMGIVMAAINWKLQREMDLELERLPDRTEFFNQLIAPDTLELPRYQLVATRDYVLRYGGSGLYIRSRRDLADKKIEQERGGFVLILTDEKGGKCTAAWAREPKAPDFVKACEAFGVSAPESEK